MVVIGLWYVKWQPYYGKAFTAAETHSIGKSILANAADSPWRAALDYAMQVWQSRAGTLLLYGAALVHVGLAFEAVYQRRTWTACARS